MSDDEESGGRPRRATVKVKRRSLRVPVDEVPRRSSPSLPRITVPPNGPAAAAALPPLEPQRTDPGTHIAELSDSELEIDESREMEAVRASASDAESLLVSGELESLRIESSSGIESGSGIDATSALMTADESTPGMMEEPPSLADLGLDAAAVARANAEEEEPEQELTPEATVVTDSPADQQAAASAPKSAPPPPRPSDRPSSSVIVEVSPASSPDVVVERVSATPSTPGVVVVVSRVAMVGTPTPSQPLRISAELKAFAEAAKDDAIELDVDEGRTSAPPEEVENEDLSTDEIDAEALVEMPAARGPRPSRPPPPSSRSVQGMPALSGERPAPPPPPAIPSGHPPPPHTPPAMPIVSAPPPPPRETASPGPTPPAAPSASAASAAAPEAPRTKKKGFWWEDFFNDDYLRTVPSPNPKQVRRQCDFIEQRLGLTPGATVLDVGCGLGLHACELTRRGYVIVGLDLSLPMLSRAADEAQDQGFKINFLHADMREMSFDSAFDAVLSWGTTFGYFEDDTNRTVLDRMHRALKPGGLLMLDIVNRDYVIRSQPNNVWFEGDGCVVMEETQCNYITSRLHVKRTVMLDDGRQRESAYSVRLYALHELGQMLHQKFRVVEVSGRESTPGVYFGADSPRTIIVAERRLPAAPPGPPVPPSKRSEADHTPPPAPPPTSDQG